MRKKVSEKNGRVANIFCIVESLTYYVEELEELSM